MPESQRRIYKPASTQELYRPPSAKKLLPGQDNRLSSRVINRSRQPSRDENNPPTRGTVPPNFSEFGDFVLIILCLFVALLRRDPALSNDVRITLGTTLSRNVYDPKKTEFINNVHFPKKEASKNKKTTKNSKLQEIQKNQVISKSKNKSKGPKPKEAQPLDEPRKSPFDFKPLQIAQRSMSEQNLGSPLENRQYFSLYFNRKAEESQKTVLKSTESSQKSAITTSKESQKVVVKSATRTNSIFGDAKPVDTAKKMAEIEARMKRM